MIDYDPFQIKWLFAGHRTPLPLPRMRPVAGSFTSFTIVIRKSMLMTFERADFSAA